MATPIPEAKLCVVCGPIPEGPDSRCPFCGTSIPPVAVGRAPAPDRNHLGRFRLLHEIAQGGSAIVYKAHDPQLDRIVALKVIRDASGLGTLIPRLHREANLAGNLTHPNIIAVHEVGVLPDVAGTLVHFICMDYIDGPTLAKFRARKDVPRRRLVEMVEQVARALHFAHERGVIHRDVKPDNILIRDGAVPILTDFGLAREIDSTTRLTATQMVMGTPSYMAPEQIEGPMSRVGREADVYALGATLYEALTGSAPFDGAGANPLFQRIVDEEPRPMRRLDASIDRDLDTIVLKCLEKDPARRYRTAGDLADDLRRFLESRAIAARPAGPWYRLRKFVARRRALSAVAAALVLVCGAAAVQFVRSSRREAALTELSARWNDVVVARQGIYKAQLEPAAVRADMEAATARLSDFIERHPDMPEALHARARAWLYLGRIDEAEADVRRALELDPEFGSAWAMLGRVLVERYKISIALSEPEAPLLEQAKAAFRTASEHAPTAGGVFLSREDRDADTIRRGLTVYHVAGDAEGAIRLLTEANSLQESEELHCWLGLWRQGSEEAHGHLQRAVDMAPHFSTGHAELGFYLWKKGRPLDAEVHLRHALEIEEEMLSARGNLAAMLLENRRLEEARIEVDLALQTHPGVRRLLFLRALVSYEMSDLEGAETFSTRTLALDPEYAAALALRALSFQFRHRKPEALADWEAVARLEPMNVQAHANRGALYSDLGNDPSAEAAFARALELQADGFTALAGRAGIRYRQGRYREAIDDLTAAIPRSPDNASREHAERLLRDCRTALRESDF